MFKNLGTGYFSNVQIQPGWNLIWKSNLFHTQQINCSKVMIIAYKRVALKEILSKINAYIIANVYKTYVFSVLMYIKVMLVC